MSVPTLDSLLAPFARNFADRLSAEPGRFLLTPQAAAELAAVVSPYLAAAEATAARANQSPALTAVRAAAKAKLLPHLRGVYARVQASGEVAAADKLLLGIVVRRPRRRIGRPATAPVLWVEHRYDTTVRVRAREAGGASMRARPAGTAGLIWFTAVGPAAPTTADGWRHLRHTARTAIDITFDRALPAGTSVHVCAAWRNRVGETGPISAATSTVLAGGGMARAAG